MTKMNTQHVKNGQLMELALDFNTKQQEEEQQEERFLVKWQHLSLVHVSWQTRLELLTMTANGKHRLQKYWKVGGSEEAPEVDRIWRADEGKTVLVKWHGAPYSAPHLSCPLTSRVLASMWRVSAQTTPAEAKCRKSKIILDCCATCAKRWGVHCAVEVHQRHRGEWKWPPKLSA